MKDSYYSDFLDYYRYAQSLTSRMIIEMILHWHKNVGELDQVLTKIGFGDYEKISENYQPFRVNMEVWSKVFTTKLPRL